MEIVWQSGAAGGHTRESTISPEVQGPYHPDSVLAALAQPIRDPVTGIEQQQDLVAQNSQHQPDLIQATQNSHLLRKQQRQLTWHKKQTQGAAPPTLSDHHITYLEEVGALIELPQTTTDALIPIYVSLLNDLLPIVDGAKVFRDYSNGLCSRYLVRAICLVVSKYKQAAPFLRFCDNGPVHLPLEFASKLLVGLDTAIKAGLEPNRVTKTQILTLMHLYNDGPGGLDRSSSHLSQAICEAWALSLHLKFPRQSDQEQCDMLWWSLRNLDRLNKVVMAAGPFMVDDTDISLERVVPKDDSYRSQIMSISLALGDLMATATKVYKASSKATVDDCHNFPSFFELVPSINLDDLHQSHRRYLEIWYHLAAMLSCRYSGPGSSLYNRRLASADRALEILSRGGHTSLPPLPLVPYAMSMATTIIYRALRDVRRDPDAAYKDLTICSETLDALSEIWTTVEGTAKLTKRILKVLTASRTLKAQGGNAEKRGTGRGRPDIAAVNTSGISSIERWNEATTRHGEVPILPVTVTVQPKQSVQGEQLPLNDKQSSTDQQPHVGYLPGIRTPFSQLDTAFSDLLDYTMPNVFRDPTVWGLFDMGASDEESFYEFQLSSPGFAGLGAEVGGYDPGAVDSGAQGAWLTDLR